ncbi:hypothetical protein B0I35DRAFT_439502 [Stachybotrys elegans]|uniref:CFEM domain-containing protein n=1 Tax=Stachybotrys elegans TaxID=80388 RepID=A0A8K0SPQ3_9HYPO|nr:hypothetical protein B0I35DRAFT_439502 [Stachybotrys elegans]
MAFSPALASLPTCALTCLIGAIGHSECMPTNQTCICADTAMQAEATACITSACTVREALFTKNVTMANCGAPIRDSSHEYVITTNILGVLIGVFVAQRLAFKLYYKLGFAIDDWLLLTTVLLFTTPSLVINVHGLVAHGMGRDIWNVPFDDITEFLHFFQAMAILYFAQIAMIKLVVLFFLLRVFPSPGVRKLLWGTVVFNVLLGVIFVLVAMFQCLPMGYFGTRWDHEHEGRCLNINAITWSNAIISIAVDIWTLAIPLYQVRTLKLSLKKKIGVGMMFTVGMCFTIMSILRLRVLVSFGSNTNVTWHFIDVCLWSTLEIAMGVICACMPSFRMLLIKFWPSIFSGDSYASRPAGSQYGYGYGRSATSSKVRRKGTTISTVTVGGATDDSQKKSPSMNGGVFCSRTYDVEYEEEELELVPPKQAYLDGPRLDQ